jgi:hypothetical protein
VRLFFCIHGVHHQSERMNLSVALRQTWFSDLHALLFYWPLPLLGVAKEPFFVAVAFLSAYQVTLHTRLFRRASAWGMVFNTPSHHRVHHARAGAGGGRNFGATLIVWDRLLGTFQAEAGDLALGVDPPLATWNPVQAQIALMGPPRRPAASIPPGRSDAYAVFQAAALFGAIAVLVRASHRLPLGLIEPEALISVAEMAALGALVDGDPRWERARLALLGAGGALLWAFGRAPAGAAILVLAAGSALAFRRALAAISAGPDRGRSTPRP